MSEPEDDLRPIGDVVAERTTKICRQIVEATAEIGFSDQEMGKLTQLSTAEWTAIRLGFYPHDFDLPQFTRIKGLIETFELAKKTFQIPARVRTWMICKNIALYSGTTTPFEAIASKDDLESVYDILVIGDPNRMDLDDLENVA